jgi:hypothetical protein
MNTAATTTIKGTTTANAPLKDNATTEPDNNDDDEEEGGENNTSNNDCCCAEWITRSLLQDGYNATSLSSATRTNVVDDDDDDDDGKMEAEGGRSHHDHWEAVMDDFISGKVNILVVDGGEENEGKKF